MDRQMYLTRISAGVKTYLKPQETVERVVSAQTFGQIWLLLPITVMIVAFVVGNYVLHANKILVIAVLGLMFISILAVNSRTQYRYIVVTNQRTLLVGGGYFGADPGANLLRQLSRDKDVDIPSGRWKKFDSLGERLYVRYSIEAPAPKRLPEVT